MGKAGPKSKHGLAWGSITKKGYIRGYDTKENRQRLVHCIVWEAHHGKIPKGYQVHHKNGDKLDNRLENLELLDTLTHKRLHGGCYQEGDGRWIKPCRKCGAHKSIEQEFYKRSDGISAWCKECCKENVLRNKRLRREKMRSLE